MARTGKLAIAGLAAMVVVDAVLVAMAVRHVRGGSPDLTDVVATPLPTSTSREGPAGRPTTGPTPTEYAARVLVDIGSGDAVARARTGTCGKGGGTVELSRDGGETFARTSVPGAQVILRVAASDIDRTTVIAADAKCGALSTYQTTNGGGTWNQSDGTVGSWHRVAKAAASLHAPEGDVEVPCAGGGVVTGFSTLTNTQGFALCAKGTVLATSDAGESWEQRGTAAGADDLDFVDSKTGLAAAVGDRSCAGVAILRTVDGGQTWTRRACVKSAQSALPDISADASRAYLAQGATVWFSADGGATWAVRARG
ncbi:WD40/YVTN/BNR-like repeat-containing protein [Actinopolymorpha pittospori]